MTDHPSAGHTADLLGRLRAGDAAARDALLAHAAGRLERLARTLLRGQFKRVGRWEDTADVFQNATLRLWKTLAVVTPDNPLHFHRLAASALRRELIDLARHYYGPLGGGARHESVGGGSALTPPALDPGTTSGDPAERTAVGELAERVQALPNDEAAVTDLLFFQGLSQEEAAGLLGVDVRTVQRRWQRARRALGALLGGK